MWQTSRTMAGAILALVMLGWPIAAHASTTQAQPTQVVQSTQVVQPTLLAQNAQYAPGDQGVPAGTTTFSESQDVSEPTVRTVRTVDGFADERARPISGATYVLVVLLLVSIIVAGVNWTPVTRRIRG